jgi:hypothetical protein
MRMLLRGGVLFRQFGAVTRLPPSHHATEDRDYSILMHFPN